MGSGLCEAWPRLTTVPYSNRISGRAISLGDISSDHYSTAVTGPGSRVVLEAIHWWRANGHRDSGYPVEIGNVRCCQSISLRLPWFSPSSDCDLGASCPIGGYSGRLWIEEGTAPTGLLVGGRVTIWHLSLVTRYCPSRGVAIGQKWLSVGLASVWGFHCRSDGCSTICVGLYTTQFARRQSYTLYIAIRMVRLVVANSRVMLNGIPVFERDCVTDIDDSQ